MFEEKTQIKRALLSVSDKTGIVELAKALDYLGVEIISTGGTAKTIAEAGVRVIEVSEVTGCAELMNGRVKTLHPAIAGGILARPDRDADEMKKYDMQTIDLVVVNLYPFQQVISTAPDDFENAIENIDIGGPTMLRAAAKNFQWVTVLTDFNDYDWILKELHEDNGVSFSARKTLANKVFSHTAQYDSLIASYMNEDEFPEKLTLSFERNDVLRYGENPQQKAASYVNVSAGVTRGVPQAKQLQGKELSYNNIEDSNAAIACVSEFNEPTCVIVKHSNPCGVACSDSIDDAFAKAFAADSLSAFGGIVALNRPCNDKVARGLKDIFMEVIIAPEFSQEALTIFSKKKNLRLLKMPIDQTDITPKFSGKFVSGGLLWQETDCKALAFEDCKVVTKIEPTLEDMQELFFAWHVVKHVKSNAIAITKNNVTCGIGEGQVSRIEAVHLALSKAGDSAKDGMLASDAFFPFRDSIDALAESGIKCIIQPGGSIRDDEVIAACDELGIAMVFTGLRHFKH